MFAVYVPIGPSRMGKIHISDVLNGHVMGCNGVYYPNVLRNIVLQVTFFINITTIAACAPCCDVQLKHDNVLPTVQVMCVCQTQADVVGWVSCKPSLDFYIFARYLTSRLLTPTCLLNVLRAVP